MRREIKLLHQKLNATMIYVTHDQIEALTLADRIVVMSMGHVQQIGTPLEIYSDPNNKFVASFVGNPPMNFFDGEISEDGRFVCDAFSFKLNEEKLALIKKNNLLGSKIILGARPEHLLENGDIETEVELVEHLGPATLFHVLVNGKELVVKLPGWLDYKTGEKLNISFNQDLICFFNAESEERVR